MAEAGPSSCSYTMPAPRQGGGRKLEEKYLDADEPAIQATGPRMSGSCDLPKDLNTPSGCLGHIDGFAAIRQ